MAASQEQIDALANGVDSAVAEAYDGPPSSFCQGIDLAISGLRMMQEDEDRVQEATSAAKGEIFFALRWLITNDVVKAVLGVVEKVFIAWRTIRCDLLE